MKKITAIAVFTVSTLIQGVAIAGDAGAGKATFSSRGCIGCHGAGGMAPLAGNPVIGGKPADFISGELTKLRSGERASPVMNAMAGSLSDDDIANLAAYLSSQ